MRNHNSVLVQEFKTALGATALANTYLAFYEIYRLCIRGVPLVHGSVNLEIVPVSLVSTFFIWSAFDAALRCQHAIRNHSALAGIRRVSVFEFDRNSYYALICFSVLTVLDGLSAYARYHQQPVAFFMDDPDFTRTSRWLVLSFIFNALAHRIVIIGNISPDETINNIPRAQIRQNKVVTRGYLWLSILFNVSAAYLFKANEHYFNGQSSQLLHINLMCAMYFIVRSFFHLSFYRGEEALLVRSKGNRNILFALSCILVYAAFFPAEQSVIVNFRCSVALVVVNWFLNKRICESIEQANVHRFQL